MPEMNNVAEYMLCSTWDKNEPVEACEFWLTFAEDPGLAGYLQVLLGKVAPILLECMVYGENHHLRLDAEADDANVPDKETRVLRLNRATMIMTVLRPRRGVWGLPG